MRHPAWPLTDLARHAEAAWPEECCGVVLADGRYFALANTAGDRRHAFRVDPAEFLRVLRTGDAPLALVHSHCDAPAKLSPEDREAALACGSPLWPGVQLLVTCVRNGRCVEGRVYAWNDAVRDFLELENLGFAGGF